MKAIKRTIASALPLRRVGGFLALTLPLFGVGVSSCSEKEEVGEFDHWQEKNQYYVDSIADLANTDSEGWSKMVAFNLVDSVESLNPNNNHYIYIQKIEEGTGIKRPEYNDSVRVHYIGRLIPSASYEQGYVFDKSYSTYTFNEETDVPALLGVKGDITGFSTAIMNMVEGDRWKVVIPYYLGYGISGYSTVPGYSALIFDIKMARVYRYKIDTNTTWH